jgi:uncharacterized protein YjbJ (UPF0337 family)
MASAPTIAGVKLGVINGDCRISRGEAPCGVTNEVEDHPMNPDTVEGWWTCVRAEITSWGDKLTDVDLEEVAGKKDALVASVQEKYQYTRERAQQEVDRRLQEYSDQLGASGASRVIETGQETAVADTVAGAVSSIRETSVQDLAGNLTDLIRRHPIPSLLIGLGVGFVLARILDKPTTGQGA